MPSNNEKFVPLVAGLLFSLVFIAAAVVGTYLLVEIWPSRGDAHAISKRVLWGWQWKLTADQHLLVLILLTGALGGIARSLIELGKWLGARQLKWSRLVSYIAFPVQGALLSIALYVVIRAGFAGFDGDKTQELKAYGYIALALLTGLFAHIALGKLKQVAESVFAKEPDTEGKPGGDDDAAQQGQGGGTQRGQGATTGR